MLATVCKSLGLLVLLLIAYESPIIATVLLTIKLTNDNIEMRKYRYIYTTSSLIGLQSLVLEHIFRTQPNLVTKFILGYVMLANSVLGAIAICVSAHASVVFVQKYMKNDLYAIARAALDRLVDRIIMLVIFQVGNLGLPSPSIETVIKYTSAYLYRGEKISFSTYLNRTVLDVLEVSDGDHRGNCIICQEELLNSQIVRKMLCCGIELHANCSDTYVTKAFKCAYCLKTFSDF